MPRAVFEKAARGLFRAFGGIKLVKLFGGEPLLNFALVRHGVSYIHSLGFAPDFELGTNGLLLDGARAGYFRRHPEIQVNINAAFGVKREFLSLPNLIWNLCVLPGAQEEAVALLGRLAGLSKNTHSRVNLLPASYCEWLPGQLAGLKRTAREMGDIIRRGGLVFENAARTGTVPLFNDGPAVDTDGKVYRTNLCLAAMPQNRRAKLLLRPGAAAAAARKKDLVGIFGLRAAAASFAADRIMWAGIHE